MVREFAEKEIRPLADEIDKTGRFPAESIAALSEMGIMGLNIPEEYGGAYRAMDGKLKGVTLHTMLDLVPLSALSEAASSGITPVSWFSGGGLRTAANEGRGDIMPCHYRDMPGLFRDYIDIDALFQLLPVNEVNDPYTIAQLPNFVSVNSALEVDFFGQVCAESMGTRHVSGSGGQADYVRGAVQSKGGQSFIAFASTAKDETISRICPTLAPGAIVTTSKNDVDCIVTEYGIAKLRGKTLSQRTKALIAIAHPKFRDELTHQAKQQNIII